MDIKKIENKEEKYEIVLEILLDLPEWFGLKESLLNYAEEAKEKLMWVAIKDKNVIGFITLSETSIDTGEIHCMGVRKDYHRKGIGKYLYLELENYCKKKYKFLQVKTVDEGNYKEYDKTIKFYKSMGFSKLEVFPTLWDEWNPCLILVKYIG